MAAVIAFFPAAASAVTIDPTGIQPGSSHDTADAPFFFGAQFLDGDGAGVYDFEFTNSTSGAAAITVSEGTVLQQTLNFLGGVTVEWLTAGTSFFIDEGATTGFEISSLIGAGASDTLRISFGDPEGGPGTADIDFSVAVAAIPLPASLPLLIGALGGLGYLSRRRRMAA